MKRVIVDHYGGPEVLKVVEEPSPRPRAGEVRVRVLAAGVSFTDSQLRAGTYIHVPKPPFTPGYELVGIVEELGPGCEKLQVGDRIGALTVWGADAERVLVPEREAFEVPDDLDPAEVVSLLFPYMTAYQVLHRTAKAKPGESVLVHGAAGRVGTALLELGSWPVTGFTGRLPRATASWSRRTARWRSTTGARTSSPGSGADRRRRRRRGRQPRRLDLGSLLPGASAGRTARRLRPLLDALARTQELARVDGVVRVDRDRRAHGAALSQ